MSDPSLERQVRAAVTRSVKPLGWRSRPGLVFLGLSLNWRRKVEDLTLNSRIAQEWQERFSEWTIDQRTVQLSQPSKRYGVRLTDGLAQFRVESESAWEQALIDTSELVDRLQTEGRDKLSALLQAQFLHEIDLEFPQLVDHLRSRLLGGTFEQSLGVTIEDFAYLSDVRYAEDRMQLSIGPLRAHEVTGRVQAQHIARVPKVSMFVSVSARKDIHAGHPALQEAFDNVFSVGQAIAKELLP